MKRAVAYLRRSTDDKQADSLDIQRHEINAYASEHGYQVVQWYVDDGISGHDVDRDDFVRMIEDAEQGNEFDFVLVRHQSRFARFRPAKTIRYLDRLDDVGVKLVTTKQGVVDITDLGQFLMASIEAQTDHAYSKTLSELTVKGQALKASEGYSAGQAAPYGMDRMLVDGNGAHQRRVRNGEKVAKPDGWKTTFVPGAEDKVATVRFIFAQYLEGNSPWTIAKTLNRRGTPSPRGGTWNKGTIRDMLLNPIYCGDYRWNKTRQGKFHSLVDGKAKERGRAEAAAEKTGRRKHAVLKNDEEDWLVVEDAHEGIIDRTDWQRVQELMNSGRQNPSRGTKAAGRYEYLLRGLVYCECGAKMHGRITRRRKNGKEYRKRIYVCSAYDSSGTCKHNWCDASLLHETVVNQFIEAIRNPANLDRLTAIMNRKSSQPTDHEPQIKQLTRQLADLDQKLESSSARLLDTPEDMLDALYDSIRLKRRQRRAVEAELASLKSQSLREQQTEWTSDEVITLVERLAEELESVDPKEVQQVLKANIECVRLKFRTEEQGKRRIQRVAGGEIHLVTEKVMAGARLSRNQRLMPPPADFSLAG